MLEFALFQLIKAYLDLTTPLIENRTKFIVTESINLKRVRRLKITNFLCSNLVLSLSTPEPSTHLGHLGIKFRYG